jgi:hypothetical protein
VLYLIEKDDYLIVGGNPAVDDKATFTAILSGDSKLTKSAAYAAATSGINAYNSVFIYANIAAMAQQNTEALEQLFQANAGMSGMPAIGSGMTYIKDYETLGVSVNLESPDFLLDAHVTMADDARTKKLWNDVQVNKTATLSIVEAPLLFLSWAVNVEEYYKLLTELQGDAAANPLEGPLGTFEAITGIDAEDELIQNLGGNVNLGVYDGSTITVSTYNTLLSLTVKDEAAMKQVLDKAINGVQAPQAIRITTETIDGVETYVAMAGLAQIFLGVHDKQVILTTSKPMYQKALAGKANNGFAGNIEPKELAETLQNTGNVFYLNVDELVKAIRNFEMFLQGWVGGAGMMQDVYTTAQKFEYISASSELQDNTIATQFQIKTRFTEPFLVELVKIIDAFNSPASN